MKVKVIGFKVGKARPTFNKTLDIGEPSQVLVNVFQTQEVGCIFLKALMRSDFLSVRWCE